MPSTAETAEDRLIAAEDLAEAIRALDIFDTLMAHLLLRGYTLAEIEERLSELCINERPRPKQEGTGVLNLPLIERPG